MKTATKTMKDDDLNNPDAPSLHRSREHRRRRFRRHRRRAYIRSVYSLPSLATLGNAICGFGAIYISAMTPDRVGNDPWTRSIAASSFLIAAYLIFLAMVFDALDGRLARFTRHTTDFGGQLDSLADVISFGAAPAFLALQVFKHHAPPDLPYAITRLIWAIGALYLSCAAMRLARFNVSNEHGEQHHFSFLGLPSPGAGGAVAALVLLHQSLLQHSADIAHRLAGICLWLLPVVVLATGLLMVSNIRYPHLVNRYVRGRRSIGRLLVVVAIGLALVVWHQYLLAIGMLLYVLSGVCGWLFGRIRARQLPPPPPASGSSVPTTPQPLP